MQYVLWKQYMDGPVVYYAGARKWVNNPLDAKGLTLRGAQSLHGKLNRQAGVSLNTAIGYEFIEVQA